MGDLRYQIQFASGAAELGLALCLCNGHDADKITRIAKRSKRVTVIASDIRLLGFQAGKGKGRREFVQRLVVNTL